MTVVVTLSGGTIDKYMPSGDAYAKHHDGTLDVVRLGAKCPYSYASGEWTDVAGLEHVSAGMTYRAVVGGAIR
jgi:hypothetical protein